MLRLRNTYLSHIFLLSFFIFSNHSYAEITENLELNQIYMVDNPYLQSLYNIPKNQTFTAPFVHEMFTRQKIRTLFIESHSLPFVDIQLTFNAGSARDASIAKDLNGLASLTARLMSEGTSKHSADEIAQTFAQLGAQYSAQAYRDMFVVKLRVFSNPERLNPAIQQLIELVTDAIYPQSSIDQLLGNVQVGQKQLQDNPTRSMSVRFYREAYGTHPYAEPIPGTLQSLRRIQSRHIQRFREQYLVAKNLNIAITGDLNSVQARHIANTISSQLPLGEAAKPLIDATPLEKTKIINLPFNSSQVYVMFGAISTTNQDPERYALEVGNYILGGSGFNSLLMQELREKRGFTYSATSQLSIMQSQGLLTASYSTQAEQFLSSLEIAYQTFLNFLYQPLDRNLVEQTKKNMLKAFPLQLSSNANINAQLGLIGFYGLPSNYLSEYPTYISSVQAEDIQHAWQTHFDPQKLLIITAGKSVDGKAMANILQTQMTHLKQQQAKITDTILSNDETSLFMDTP